MRRRDFIAGIAGSAAAWPLTAHAQQGDRVRRMGVLMGYAENDSEAQAWVAAFREELEKLGWTDGRNISIETRWAASDAEAMQRFAKELVALQPDIIVSQLTVTTAALLEQTRTIPIVFAMVADPVGSGFVASLSRPGGQVTGFATLEDSLAGKWLELLKGNIRRILPDALENRWCVLGSTSNRGARSRRLRARIHNCNARSRIKYRFNRDARFLLERPPRGPHISGCSLPSACCVSVPTIR